MKRLILIFLLLCSQALAQETISEFSDKTLPTLNDQLTQLNKLKVDVRNGLSLTSQVTGILPIANGGTALTTATDDSVLIGAGSKYVARILPSCSTSSSILTYNTTNNAFSCATNVALLLSTTTFSGATSTGNIAITAGKYYKIIIKGIQNTTPGAWDLNFNADTGNNYYRIFGGYTNGADTAWTKATGQAQIRLTSTGAASTIPTTLYIEAELTFIPSQTDTSVITVFGDIRYDDSSAGGAITFLKLMGNYDGASAVSSYVLSTTAGTFAGTIYTYELSTS